MIESVFTFSATVSKQYLEQYAYVVVIAARIHLRRHFNYTQIQIFADVGHSGSAKNHYWFGRVEGVRREQFDGNVSDTGREVHSEEEVHLRTQIEFWRVGQGARLLHVEEHRVWDWGRIGRKFLYE